MTCDMSTEILPKFAFGKALLESEEENVPQKMEVPAPEPCASLHKRVDFKLIMRLRQAALEEVFTVRRLGLDPCPKQAWNPSALNVGKCTAVVRFKVSRPINIESYGFFGPHQVGGRGKYHMDISLLTEEFMEIASATVVTPIVKNNEIFHVKFESPVPILPCIWYFAKFSLLGPPTSQSTKVIPFASVKCGDFQDTRFTFDMPDSNQLPEIGFTIRA